MPTQNLSECSEMSVLARGLSLLICLARSETEGKKSFITRARPSELLLQSLNGCGMTINTSYIVSFGGYITLTIPGFL